jgi:hypothetical protein
MRVRQNTLDSVSPRPLSNPDGFFETDGEAVNSPAKVLQNRLERAIFAQMGAPLQSHGRALDGRKLATIVMIAFLSWTAIFGLGALILRATT